jgi:hypothetical protein
MDPITANIRSARRNAFHALMFTPFPRSIGNEFRSAKPVRVLISSFGYFTGDFARLIGRPSGPP